MRLALVIYFIPFFFVYNPALLIRGKVAEVVAVLFTVMVGIAVVAAALQGYLIGLGDPGNDMLGWLSHANLRAGGLSLATMPAS